MPGAHPGPQAAPPVNFPDTARGWPGSDPVMVEELGLLLHDRGEVAVLVAGHMPVAESMTDLVVDQHLPVRVDLVAVGHGPLRPPIGVDHHAVGGGRVAGHVVLGGVETGLGAPEGGGPGARQGDHEVGLAGGDPLERTTAVVGPAPFVVERLLHGLREQLPVEPEPLLDVHPVACTSAPLPGALANPRIASNFPEPLRAAPSAYVLAIFWSYVSVVTAAGASGAAGRSSPRAGESPEPWTSWPEPVAVCGAHSRRRRPGRW